MVRLEGRALRTSLGDIRKASQIAVGSFRAGISNWVRFVKALQIAVASLVNGIRFVRGIKKALQFAHHSFPRSPWECRPGRSASAFIPAQKQRGASKTAFPIGAREPGELASFRHRPFGSFGETIWRHRLPWLRFVKGIRFVRGHWRGVTDCRGFVSRRHFELGSFRQGVTDYRGFDSSTADNRPRKRRHGRERRGLTNCQGSRRSGRGGVEPYYRASNAIIPVRPEDHPRRG